VLVLALIIGYQTGNTVVDGFLFSVEETTEESKTQDAPEVAAAVTPSGKTPR
jgi:hypothetical protein